MFPKLLAIMYRAIVYMTVEPASSYTVYVQGSRIIMYNLLYSMANSSPGTRLRLAMEWSLHRRQQPIRSLHSATCTEKFVPLVNCGKGDTCSSLHGKLTCSFLLQVCLHLGSAALAHGQRIQTCPGNIAQPNPPDMNILTAA